MRSSSFVSLVLFSIACTSAPDPTPAPVIPPPPEESSYSTCVGDDCVIVELAAGGYLFSSGFTCARLASGGVDCFGAIGYPDVARIPEIDNAVELVGQGGFACIRKRDGGVDCAHIVEFASSSDPSPPVTEIAGLRDSLSIAVGGAHVCGITTDRRVKCWGPMIDPLASELFETQEVMGLSGVEELALGFDHSCALLDDGGVWCWGANDVGQLGADVTERCDAYHRDRIDCSTTPVEVLSGARAIWAGGFYTCALLEDSRLSCWGYLGAERPDVYGFPEPSEVCAEPDPGCAAAPTVVAIENVEHVAIGKEHACARLADGTLRCWGGNRAGQLGRGDITSDLEGVVDPGLSDVEQVVAGRLHTCALLSNGKVYCWGDHEHGQLGPGLTLPSSCVSVSNSSYPCSPSPTEVLGVQPAP